ncbi:MAG: hypothetical protein Q8R98_29090 [Rubrivivax sp.]|nr:hypothetical protein [Rubrivivax sp.]MDP3615914.1 hypothetical protein [Rubrivivax sp.]
MTSTFQAAAFCLAALALTACDKKPADPPLPQVTAAPAQGATAGIASDPSVPDAAAVFPASAASQPAVTAGRENKSISASQESTAMPLPGQNNDHSAPLIPAKPASSSR